MIRNKNCKKATTSILALLFVQANAQFSLNLDIFPKPSDFAALFGCNKDPNPPPPPPEEGDNIVWTSVGKIPLDSLSAAVGTALGINKDGGRIVVGGPGNLVVYDKFISGIDNSTNYVIAKDLSESFSSFVGAVDINSSGEYLVGSNLADYDVATGIIDPTANGEVKVFKSLPNGDWKQDYSTLVSTTGQADGFGSSLSISEDGLRVAVGAPFGDYVQVVYPILDSEWEITFNGPFKNSFFGAAVSLASDGNTLAVGAPYTGDKKGAVYIIDVEGRSISHEFYGDAVGDHFGITLDLSEDASTLAVGTIGNSELIAYAKVFRLNRDTKVYNQVGEKITSVGHPSLGWPLSLSFDGGILAVGIPYNNDEGDGSGKTVVYSVNDDGFKQNGYFNGEQLQENSGSSVQISGNHEYLVVGALKNIHIWKKYVVV